MLSPRPGNEDLRNVDNCHAECDASDKRIRVHEGCGSISSVKVTDVSAKRISSHT